MPIITRSRAKNSSATQAPPLMNQEEVARVAYELFEKRGKTHGNDQRDWFEAQQIVQQRRRSGNGR